jgi:drug/metabolite transporter (DMT)-like permease
VKDNDQTQRGIFLAITSYACYALAILLIKVTPLPTELVVFARNFLGLLVFFPLILWKRTPLKTKKLSSHFFRSCFSVAAIYCSTIGVKHLNIGDAILLEQTMPFFILLILFFWRGEKIFFSHFVAMVAAFIGVICIASPQFAVFQIGALASLVAGFLVALCFILVETLVKSEEPLTTLFYFLLISSLLTLGPALATFKEINSLKNLLLLFIMGVAFASTQLLRTQALTLIPANIVGSYSYFAPLFSIILGAIFLNETLSYSRILGSIFILGSGIYIFYKKNKVPDQPPQ